MAPGERQACILCQFGFVQQHGINLHAAGQNPQAQLAPACQDLFLDLAGHARLLCAALAWRVAVGVGGKGTVGGSVLAVAKAVAHPAVVRLQRGQFWRCAVGRLEHALLHRQQQLGHHVPVDAAQAFEGEHGAGSAGESVMLEQALVGLCQGFQRRA